MIYSECKPDTALVRKLSGLPRRQLRHVRGKSEVCNRLKADVNCRGLVDEDPGNPKPPYLSEILLAREPLELGLKVYEDKLRVNRLIVLCPKLEEWILGAAR